MSNVRVAHRVALIRSSLPNCQAAPIGLPLPNYQAAPIRLPLPNHQATPMQPLLSNHQAIPRILIHHRPPTSVRKPVPRYLPVLQPPRYPREYGFYEEEEEEQEQYQEEIFYYPTVVIADQHRSIKRQLPHRAPHFVPLKNYTKQQLTRHNRHDKSKYPPNICYKR